MIHANRRAVVVGLASMAAPVAPLAAGAAEADPIFAAIERHSTAIQEDEAALLALGSINDLGCHAGSVEIGQRADYDVNIHAYEAGQIKTTKVERIGNGKSKPIMALNRRDVIANAPDGERREDFIRNGMRLLRNEAARARRLAKKRGLFAARLRYDEAYDRKLDALSDLVQTRVETEAGRRALASHLADVFDGDAYDFDQYREKFAAMLRNIAEARS